MVCRSSGIRLTAQHVAYSIYTERKRERNENKEVLIQPSAMLGHLLGGLVVLKFIK